ncbi:hypothetical protein Desaci_1325 [Desulfosporosinus acidiphilus SJ4]|uniref:Uncharacterized protein n=1 Tax=Desulfosporosinus acidiphilus (strain DSM 22704 / JCM 16185 / SJ4) TaxID=646529 RepID=I4D3H7_DESAJ|nr:hypothetical protein [Desulfosporosinus acidiphilus]AFM40351.1 hypothetical protein Desaci_1325 [Desulfosporosinus acidiphilus SJ4]
MLEVHVIKRTLTEIVIDPSHAERKESAEFRRSKERLKADGHYKCWICGTTENLQVHHFGAEWSLENVTDFEKLKVFCEEWDPYGYGRLLRNLPITTVDDVRNMLVLCQEHHTGGSKDGAANGIHEITLPVWLIQKLAKQGEDPVPQDGESVENVIKKITDL